MPTNDPRIAGARLQKYLERTKQAAISAPLATGLLAWISLDTAGPLGAAVWLLLVSAADAANYAHASLYARRRPNGDEVTLWRDRQIALHVASGLAWGLSAWLLHLRSPGGPAFGDMHLLWLVGVTAMSAATMSVFRATLPLFLVGVWFPTVVLLAFAWTPQGAGLLAGVAVLVFIAIQYAALVRSQLETSLVAEADLAEAKKALELALSQVTQLASRDALTQLLSRGHATDRIEELVALAHRHRSVESVVFLDLDHFKAVNDTRGHAGGDAVLRHVADVLRRSLRSTDLIARWGGEEFVVVLRGTALSNAQKVAEILRRRIELVPVSHDGSSIQVTASLGVAELGGGESLDAWVRRADEACYRAKAEGRNRVVASPTPAPVEAARPPLRAPNDTGDVWFRTD